jgi:hypothetical protein
MFRKMVRGKPHILNIIKSFCFLSSLTDSYLSRRLRRFVLWSLFLWQTVRHAVPQLLSKYFPYSAKSFHIGGGFPVDDVR